MCLMNSNDDVCSVGDSTATPPASLPSQPADEEPDYLSDEFRMFSFKVVQCQNRASHDWATCPFAHATEKGKRRDPHCYSGVACPSMKRNFQCPRGQSCKFAHNAFEYWLHPTRYRTHLCNDGIKCRRKHCFFAHSLEVHDCGWPISGPSLGVLACYTTLRHKRVSQELRDVSVAKASFQPDPPGVFTAHSHGGAPAPAAALASGTTQHDDFAPGAAAGTHDAFAPSAWHTAFGAGGSGGSGSGAAAFGAGGSSGAAFGGSSGSSRAAAIGGNGGGGGSGGTAAGATTSSSGGQHRLSLGSSSVPDGTSSSLSSPPSPGLSSLDGRRGPGSAGQVHLPPSPSTPNYLGRRLMMSTGSSGVQQQLQPGQQQQMMAKSAPLNSGGPQHQQRGQQSSVMGGFVNPFGTNAQFASMPSTLLADAERLMRTVNLKDNAGVASQQQQQQQQFGGGSGGPPSWPLSSSRGSRLAATPVAPAEQQMAVASLHKLLAESAAWQHQQQQQAAAQPLQLQPQPYLPHQQQQPTYHTFPAGVQFSDLSASQYEDASHLQLLQAAAVQQQQQQQDSLLGPLSTVGTLLAMAQRQAASGGSGHGGSPGGHQGFLGAALPQQAAWMHHAYGAGAAAAPRYPPAQRSASDPAIGEVGAVAGGLERGVPWEPLRISAPSGYQPWPTSSGAATPPLGAAAAARSHGHSPYMAPATGEYTDEQLQQHIMFAAQALLQQQQQQ